MISLLFPSKLLAKIKFPISDTGHRTAIEFVQRVISLVDENQDARILDTLAVAYAETRLFEHTIATAQKLLPWLKVPRPKYWPGGFDHG